MGLFKDKGAGRPAQGGGSQWCEQRGQNPAFWQTDALALASTYYFLCMRSHSQKWKTGETSSIVPQQYWAQRQRDFRTAHFQNGRMHQSQGRGDVNGHI